jgi:hypothetical protein
MIWPNPFLSEFTKTGNVLFDLVHRGTTKTLADIAAGKKIQGPRKKGAEQLVG